MTRRERLEHLRDLARLYAQNPAGAPETAAQISAVVAGLNNVLADHGAGIAFAVAGLLMANCLGIRWLYFEELGTEIAVALRSRP